MKILVEHREKEQKFIAVINGLTAELDYFFDHEAQALNYHHTFVDPALRGKGVAGTIVEFALNYALQHHYKVIPSCPFVKSYMDLHKKYKILL